MKKLVYFSIGPILYCLLTLPMFFSFQASPQGEVPPSEVNPYCDKTQEDFPIPPWACPQPNQQAKESCVRSCYDQLYWREMVRASNKACKDWNSGYSTFLSCVSNALSEYQGCLQASVTQQELIECGNRYKDALALCVSAWDLKKAQIALEMVQKEVDQTAEFYDCVDNACCWEIHQ